MNFQSLLRSQLSSTDKPQEVIQQSAPLSHATLQFNFLSAQAIMKEIFDYINENESPKTGMAK